MIWDDSFRNYKFPVAETKSGSTKRRPEKTRANLDVPGIGSLKMVRDQWDTPLKIDMEPKNGGLEDDFPFQTGDFQVPC